jgi:predicted amidophosphoribosyltransferase
VTASANPAPGVCMLCGAPLASIDRCSACGLAQEGGPGRPDPFTGRVLVFLGLLLVAVYAATLCVVLLAR